MQSGLNLLSLFLILSNTKRVKIILLLMLCRAVMLCYLNLTSKYLDWKLLRNNMCMMLNLKMCCRIVEMVELGTSSSSMMDLCSVLTNYAFQIVLFVFCCYRGAWRRIDGTLRCQEDEGCSCCTLLLATYASRC